MQENDHVVGFLGDGINDAQGLKQADVGISVDTAVDIAKESADILMLEKDLNVLEEGVVEGGRVFGSIIKYIKITASSNFGNVFSVLVASAFLPFLPMLPIQLLVQNLLYSISQVSIPWDNMDNEYLHVPIMLMTGLIMALGLIIPFTGFGSYIGFVALPERYFLWLVGVLPSYSLLTEVVKKMYIKRFDSWI